MGKIDRTGEEKLNNFGSKMKIVNYRNNKDIDIYFSEYNWIAKHKGYREFKLGRITCPYEPRFYEIGYIGEGIYNSNNSKNIFNRWNNMLRRCYSIEYQEKRPTYKGCKVCDEWLNFQNFAKWYNENYYEIDSEEMDLDKDILYKGNKIYCPEKCIFVSKKINSLFTKANNLRGDYPIGVSYFKESNKFKSQYRNMDGKEIHLGLFDTPKEAFISYKNAKEKYIKQIAEEYKNKIPQKLYKAMINYEVEIDD